MNAEQFPETISPACVSRSILRWPNEWVFPHVGYGRASISTKMPHVDYRFFMMQEQDEFMDGGCNVRLPPHVAGSI